MKRSFASFRRGPLAALAVLIVFGVWAVACELPPSRDDDPLLAGWHSLSFGREVEMQAMPRHPDEAIVEKFMRQRVEVGPFFTWSDDDLARFDRNQIDMVRFRVSPGRELQIVFSIGGIDNCPAFFGCTAYVLTLQDGEWRLLTSFRVANEGSGRSAFTVAARPFFVRPMLDSASGGSQELEYGRRILVRPVNQGRPTFVGRTSAVFWDGTEWNVGCWRLCEHR